MIRAGRPEPRYEFVPGSDVTGQPASWQQANRTGKPITISRGAVSLPQQTPGEILKEEVVPGTGVYIAREEGRPGFKIVTAKTPGLSLEQKKEKEIPLRKELQKAQGQLQLMNEKDPQYQSTVDLISAIESKLAEIKTPSAPMITAPSSGQSAPFKEGSRIRSKKDGKTYIVRNGVPVLEK